ncbi:MAG: type II toxin-antitoxin system HicA family toxin [Planctomycetota bacterium]
MRSQEFRKPKKIRELKSMLHRAGFMMRAGKGSHTVWSHAKLDESVTVSGHDGDDAKPYQEKDVRQIIRKAERAS